MIEIIVSVFILTAIVCRWLLPAKLRINREILSAMLIAYVRSHIQSFMIELNDIYLIFLLIDLRWF
jgi:hypothetical protein